ncbi:MAG: hypothetical protein DRP85_09675 [Candidatus Makaraimicrobium thalassicum]|nr:MAG: hypothetical protein DRP85_09675 [Candidatus Omnitrophota bacterium]
MNSLNFLLNKDNEDYALDKVYNSNRILSSAERRDLRSEWKSPKDSAGSGALCSRSEACIEFYIEFSGAKELEKTERSEA